MKKIYIRKRWVPAWATMAFVALFLLVLGQTVVDHLDRLTPDWTGLSRTLPFFAYVTVLIIVFGTSATHIQVSGETVRRYHTPLPIQRSLSIPVDQIEQVLFWQMGYQFLTFYGLGVQTRSGRSILSHLFRTREEVMVEVRKIADALGQRGLTTVKVAETRTAITARSSINPLIVAAAIAVFMAFYRLARF